MGMQRFFFKPSTELPIKYIEVFIGGLHIGVHKGITAVMGFDQSLLQLTVLWVLLLGCLFGWWLFWRIALLVPWFGDLLVLCFVLVSVASCFARVLIQVVLGFIFWCILWGMASGSFSCAFCLVLDVSSLLVSHQLLIVCQH